MLRAAIRIALVSWLAVAAMVGHVRAQGADDLSALNTQVIQLHREGKHAEAVPIAQRALALAERLHGADHADVGSALHNLALLYLAQRRYADAHPLYERALAVRERALGANHADVGQTVNDLAFLHRQQGRYADAEQLYRRSASIFETALGANHPHLATSLHNLAALYLAQGRYADAELLYKRSLEIREKALGPDHETVSQSLNDLAGLYLRLGRYADAERLHKRALAIKEKALGADHPSVGTTLNNLAELYRQQGRYTDAEPLYRRALAITERALGPDHPDVGTRLNNLASLYGKQGRSVDQERLYERALAIREKALGPDHPNVATSLNNLAFAYRQQGRNAEAEPLYKRALAIREKVLGPNHPEVATSLNNLAFLYRLQGRVADTEPLYRRALAISEKALGPDHPSVADPLNNLAFLYRERGRYADADQLYRRSLAIREKALGPDHPDVGDSLNNLAFLYFVQRDWVKAASHWQQSTDLVIRRTKRGTESVGGAITGEAKSETERKRYRFWHLVKVSYRLARAMPAQAKEQGGAMLQAAQWAQSSDAAASLAQMAARGVKGDGALATLVRERQDLVGEWQEKEKLLIAARSNPTDQRNAASEKLLADRLAAIDGRVATIDATLKQRFPDYAALASPEPLSVEEIQAQLRPDEVLVLFLDTPKSGPMPEETFIWAVTKTDSRWVRSDLGTPSLAREVAALRCGLDFGAWTGSNCFDLTGQTFTDADHDAGKALPFDLGRAHKLYRALFGEIQALTAGKHLLIVPSGALTQLPFHVAGIRGAGPCAHRRCGVARGQVARAQPGTHRAAGRLLAQGAQAQCQGEPRGKALPWRRQPAARWTGRSLRRPRPAGA